LALVGKNLYLLIAVVCADYLFNGMGTAALLALLMSLCNLRYTATQFALLSVFASTTRVIIGPLAGVMVVHMGWANFFVCAFFASLPGLWLLWRMREKIDAIAARTAT
jgi:PAT family beta-lactamase induction signal transducer AmpG